jgi:hypothetical protein
VIVAGIRVTSFLKEVILQIPYLLGRMNSTIRGITQVMRRAGSVDVGATAPRTAALHEKGRRMPYRDDLLSRLHESGKWKQLSPPAQKFIENMTDAQACEALATGNLFEIHDAETIASVGLFCMDQIQEAFHGNLVEKRPNGTFRLTSLGEQLAMLFDTAKANGLDWNATIQAVASLDVFEVATLFVAREGLRRFNDDS